MIIKKILSTISKEVINSSRPSFAKSPMMNSSSASVFSKTSNLDSLITKTKPRIGHELAKDNCVKHLQGAEPVEFLSIVDSSSGNIMFEKVGDASGCSLPLKAFRGNNLVLHHGHTPISSDGSTLPVSLQDFLLMNQTSSINKIIAYNTEGQQSFLKKNPLFTPLTLEQVSGLKNQYISALFEKAPSSAVHDIKKLMKYCSENPQAVGVKQEISERINALQYLKSSPDTIDKFWKKNASKLNMTYFSDFKN